MGLDGMGMDEGWEDKSGLNIDTDYLCGRNGEVCSKKEVCSCTSYFVQ